MSRSRRTAGTRPRRAAGEAPMTSSRAPPGSSADRLAGGSIATSPHLEQVGGPPCRASRRCRRRTTPVGDVERLGYVDLHLGDVLGIPHRLNRPLANRTTCRSGSPPCPGNGHAEHLRLVQHVVHAVSSARKESSETRTASRRPPGTARPARVRPALGQRAERGGRHSQVVHPRGSARAPSPLLDDLDQVAGVIVRSHRRNRSLERKSPRPLVRVRPTRSTPRAPGLEVSG